MQRLWFGICLIGAFACVACSNKDPFANGADAPAGSDGGFSDGATVDAAPHNCVTPPTRVIVIGDSITACNAVGGKQSASCMSKLFADYVIANYGTGATYENFAVGGARLVDIASQVAQIPAGTGAALVMIYIGGNDLSPFIFQPDSSALAGFEQIKTRMDTVYAETFTALADSTKFPAGATLFVNSQYNPFDDCTASPYNLSATKISILHMFNDRLRLIADAKGDAAIFVDQHAPYLGHGHHYGVASCPYYTPGVVPFMADTIHANAAGNVSLAAVANTGADRLYRDCIR